MSENLTNQISILQFSFFLAISLRPLYRLNFFLTESITDGLMPRLRDKGEMKSPSALFICRVLKCCFFFPNLGEPPYHSATSQCDQRGSCCQRFTNHRNSILFIYVIIHQHSSGASSDVSKWLKICTAFKAALVTSVKNNT